MDIYIFFVTDLTEPEKRTKAEREKEKGNEVCIVSIFAFSTLQLFFIYTCM